MPLDSQATSLQTELWRPAMPITLGKCKPHQCRVSNLATQNGGNIEKIFIEILLPLPAAHFFHFIFDIATTFLLCCLVSNKEKRPDEIIS